MIVSIHWFHTHASYCMVIFLNNFSSLLNCQRSWLRGLQRYGQCVSKVRRVFRSDQLCAIRRHKKIPSFFSKALVFFQFHRVPGGARLAQNRLKVRWFRLLEVSSRRKCLTNRNFLRRANIHTKENQCQIMELFSFACLVMFFNKFFSLQKNFPLLCQSTFLAEGIP